MLKLLGFFEPAVLAAYREQPDKFVIMTDFFDGRVTIASEYDARLDAATREKEYINSAGFL